MTEDRTDCLYFTVCKDSERFIFEAQADVCARCPNYARKVTL
jgi:hypothetical protein